MIGASLTEVLCERPVAMETQGDSIPELLTSHMACLLSGIDATELERVQQRLASKSQVFLAVLLLRLLLLRVVAAAKLPLMPPLLTPAKSNSTCYSTVSSSSQ